MQQLVPTSLFVKLLFFEWQILNVLLNVQAYQIKNKIKND